MALLYRHVLSLIASLIGLGRDLGTHQSSFGRTSRCHELVVRALVAPQNLYSLKNLDLDENQGESPSAQWAWEEGAAWMNEGPPAVQYALQPVDESPLECLEKEHSLIVRGARSQHPSECCCLVERVDEDCCFFQYHVAVGYLHDSLHEEAKQSHAAAVEEDLDCPGTCHVCPRLFQEGLR